MRLWALARKPPWPAGCLAPRHLALLTCSPTVPSCPPLLRSRRRTNQLGSSVPSAQRKRQLQAAAAAAAQNCSGELLKRQGGQPAAKQPRVSVA